MPVISDLIDKNTSYLQPWTMGILRWAEKQRALAGTLLCAWIGTSLSLNQGQDALKCSLQALEEGAEELWKVNTAFDKSVSSKRHLQSMGE